MEKIICESCGKEIEKGQSVAVFYSGGNSVYTHVMTSDNKIDCDYVYMIETCNAEYKSDVSELELE